MTRGVRCAVAVALAVVLAGGLAGCEEGVAKAKPQESGAAATSAAAEPSGTTTPSSSPSPSGKPSSSAPSTSTPPPSTARPTPPAKPSTARPADGPELPVAVTVTTAGGKLVIRGGGPAQEFTVTLRNTSERDYAHLAIGLTMEPNWGEGEGEGEPGLWPITAERWDPASRTWRKADIVVAGDVAVLYVTKGGTALKQGAERTVRYRIKATAPKPSATTGLGVDAVVTDVPEETSAQDRMAGYTHVPLTLNKS